MLPHFGKGLLTPTTVAIALGTFLIGIITALITAIPDMRESEAKLRDVYVQQRVAQIHADNEQTIKEIEAKTDIAVAQIKGRYEIQVAQIDRHTQNDAYDNFVGPWFIEPLGRTNRLNRKIAAYETALAKGVDQETGVALTTSQRNRLAQDLKLAKEELEAESRVVNRNTNSFFNAVMGATVDGWPGAMPVVGPNTPPTATFKTTIQPSRYAPPSIEEFNAKAAAQRSGQR